MNQQQQKLAQMLVIKLNEGLDFFQAWQAVYNKFHQLSKQNGMSDKQAHAFVNSWIWDVAIGIANYYQSYEAAKMFEDAKGQNFALFVQQYA